MEAVGRFLEIQLKGQQAVSAGKDG